MIRKLTKSYYILLAALTICMLIMTSQTKAASVYSWSCSQYCSDYYFAVTVDYNASGIGWTTGTTAYGGSDANPNLTNCPGSVFYNFPTVASGTLYFPIGPNYSNPNFYLAEHRADGVCHESSGSLNLITSSIFAPNNVSIGTGTYTTSIHNTQYATITWSKGSDIPDSNISYNIYRNGAKIGNVPGGTYTFNDSALLQTSSYYVYTVTTYTDSVHGTNGSPSWSRQESGQTSSYYSYYTSITNDILTASQGTNYNYCTLSWPNIGNYSPNGIAIFRNGVQIDVVNKNAAQYNDNTGTPGVSYNYAIAPIDNSNNMPNMFYATGSSRPNGQIKGNVNTIYNAGVSGVTLYAYANVNGNPIFDSTTTDASGYYEFEDLFYNTSATYTIVPHKGAHKFNPDTLTRVLNVNNNIATTVNFTDTSVYTIKGNINFSYDQHCANNGLGCESQGVTIYSNGSPTNGVTDANGNFSFAIQQEGTYTLVPVDSGHTFSPASIVLVVTQDSFGLQFTDLTRDTLFITLQGGCHNQVDDHATVTINSYGNNGYSYLNDVIRDPVTSTASQTLVMPAQQYTATITGAYLTSGSSQPDYTVFTGVQQSFNTDLRWRDSSTLSHVDTTYHTTAGINDTIQRGSSYIYITADTFPFDTMHVGLIIATSPVTTMTADTVTTPVEVKHRADFIYNGILTAYIDSTQFLNGACSIINNGWILGQNNPVTVPVYINETFSYGQGSSCPVDSGMINIYDDVSDISGVQTVPFYNGEFRYNMLPASININPPYTKLVDFYITAGQSNTSVSHKILVTGGKNLTSTFVTETPQLPFFILHAPPGNNSSSFLSQDATITNTVSTSMQVGGSLGTYTKVGIGVTVPVPFTGEILGGGMTLEGTTNVGSNYTTNTETQITTTTHSQVSTASGVSGNNNMYTGHLGDVYVGSSMNMIYAYGYVLQVPTTSCSIKIDTELIINNMGIKTTYMYTEDDIINTVVPQLQALQQVVGRNLPTTGALANHADSLSRDSANLIGTWIGTWNNVVQQNHRNTDTISVFGQNISYSAGVVDDNTFTSSQQVSSSIQYSMYLNDEVNANFEIGELDASDLDKTTLGVKRNFSWNMDKTTSSSTTNTVTTGYHLEDDNNAGNYYSMNVNTDAVYGTPCFENVLGASACPHWPGTQARDSVQIVLNTYAISNVPLTQTANFVAGLQNESESQEARTYAVAVVPESNPNGAIISIGGQQINNSAADFTVGVNSTLNVLLTVAPGPLAADYSGLQVSAYSPCDGGEGNTITFEAHFQSDCSPISIIAPADNWLVNSASNNMLYVSFAGYDTHDSIINIGLEYLQPGGTWQPATNPPIPVDSLTGPYYNYGWNVGNLADGAYQIRAYANCGSKPGGVTYSQVLSGNIARNGLALFGTPSPSDGVLNINSAISVEFTAPVNCAQAAAYIPIYCTLISASGDTIPNTVSCSGSQLIINTNPIGLIDSFENQTLTCTVNDVYDLTGNELTQPIIWSFMVNRSKEYWGPASINLNANTGDTAFAIATMYNTGPRDSFTIIHKPYWLSTPAVPQYIITTGTLLSPSTLAIPFTVSATLNPGTYSDTVVALASGKRVFLFVTVNVLSPAPNWSVNANNYQYSMNITTNYSTTQLNAPLSSNASDKIAAFAGNQCRGVGYITYNPATNSYAAFITAYSNSVVGDTFTFRMWDAVPGIEYQSVERLPFITDASIGQPQAPYILHPAGQFQTITFAPGWNWFSLNVATTNMSPNNVLASITGNNGAIVKTQSTYDQFTTAATGWTGSLATFSTSSSYMIYLDHADTLHFLGKPLIDTSVVQIASGWNWVGFPRTKIDSANDYLANVNASNGDLLKSQTQYTQYNAGIWSGSLQNMFPGEGYKLKTANAFNFVVEPDRSLPSWNVDVNQFEQNMTVTADLQFNGTSTRQSNYLVGAFADSICLGTAQPEFLASQNIYRVFMTIHGDSSNTKHPLTFRVYDTNNDIEYTPTYMPISVVPDTVVAKVEEAYVINVETTTGINALNYTDGFSLLQNVPNPFAKNTSISYTIPSDGQVSMSLYDESGRLVKELVNGVQTSGNHTVSFEQDNLQPGIYFYQMKSGEFVKTRRMLIIQ
jgi:hypothetical protein